MTGQTEGDKPGRLKEEVFTSLQYLCYHPITFLIAKQLQFWELNRTYKYPTFAPKAARQPFLVNLIVAVQTAFLFSEGSIL